MRPRTRLPRSTARRRRGGRTRLFVLGAACLAPIAAATPALAAAEQGPVVAGSAARSGVVRFDIAPGLARRRAGRVRACHAASAPFSTIPASARCSRPASRATSRPSRPWAQLLTGLAVRATFDGGAVTLAVRGVNEFVEVSGSVPRNAQSPKYRDEIRDTRAGDRRHPAEGLRGAERDHAGRRAAQHAGHHDEHRRRRQRHRELRRQHLHPRLQRPQRHLHRRRPRSGRSRPATRSTSNPSKWPRARRRSPAAAAPRAARSTWSRRRRRSPIRRAAA